MKSKTQNTILAIGLISLCLWLLIRAIYIQVDVKNNKEVTTGKIIKLTRGYQARYGLIYEYNIEGKRYTGQIGIDPFLCDDGTKNCVGKEFVVYYSSKNPENSRIDLGKYEKYKTTVEFVK
ncbi:hypothetical protein N9X55_02520 [Flavobacteriaceae bacterium]|jgi:hypothetical protein|nr:hypothetical protein [Flavobacteriaceae bacterium]|tara:strand:+ start:625 stop:987 length:363 start_codon:yes stop_codon:yes gene_type:complete